MSDQEAETEQDVMVFITVCIPTYGKPSEAVPRTMRELGRLVYNGLSTTAVLEDDRGRRWQYDPFVHEQDSKIKPSSE